MVFVQSVDLAITKGSDALFKSYCPIKLLTFQKALMLTVHILTSYSHQTPGIETCTLADKKYIEVKRQINSRTCILFNVNISFV